MTRAWRRRTVYPVAVLGARQLGRSLASRPGSREFYVRTLSVAATWTLGTVVSGPVPPRGTPFGGGLSRRSVLLPVVTGGGAFGLFYGCALLARHVPVLDDAVGRALALADEADASLVALTAGFNAVAEELFFRGAVYSAADRHPVAVSTAAYTLATAPTRNPALVLAAAVMGTLFAWQRRASGGVQASTLTHLTWSVLMLRYLPPLFRGDERAKGSPLRGERIDVEPAGMDRKER